MDASDYKVSAVFFALLLLISVAGAGIFVLLNPPEESETRNATVLRVVDADTLEVEFEDGERDTIRLLGMDSPEISVDNQPSEFEDVPNDSTGGECLRDWGFKAKEYVESRLPRNITVVYDSESPQRGGYDRLLAYVYVNSSDSRSLNLELISKGYARVYDSEFTRRSTFYEAEEEAQRNAIGLWECAP